MDAIEAIRGRRSIRDYQAGRVPRALIEAILDDAAQAPTPPLSGEHPFAFLVIEGKKRVAECGVLALRHAREHRPPGPGYDWVERPGFSVFFDAPAAVVICGADEALDQALQDCNRAGQNLMLSAHARGLGTCWVGSPMLWLRHPGTAAALGVPAGYRPCAAFALGYPATLPAPRGRPAPAVVWAGLTPSQAACPRDESASLRLQMSFSSGAASRFNTGTSRRRWS